ncbi:Hypothetical protein SMAX5B_018949 [Scophthalmus maximus]|uniref:Uncharacterized protein n=1 Tax=Scophthalmus maximus TaxID=52904 RepID=A0A2U9C6R1_SCOMX|nr:Hypothetical protein SMAX5B_018949 [Scophthalmus maximus]
MPSVLFFPEMIPPGRSISAASLSAIPLGRDLPTGLAEGSWLLSTEEQVTLITESMTVTSADQEKLLLLNRNTELRRVNKELMKLNEDWDQVYRSATLGLQQKLEALELENAAVKQLNSRLLLKVEHQQSAKEYYEQTLMQELKKNQELQEYIRLLESRMQHPERASAHAKQGGFSAEPCPSSNPPRGPDLSPSHYSRYNPSSSLFQAPSSPEERWQGKSQSGSTPLGDSPREVQELKEQLDALRCQGKICLIIRTSFESDSELRHQVAALGCAEILPIMRNICRSQDIDFIMAHCQINVLYQQTQIYEAEYQTEHKDHKHTQQENRRLRKKREEMRQQVALLQEQLKVYEDDFRRERSDKQMLQRLLLKKTTPSKDPVLIHRCNNAQQPPGGDKRTQSAEKRKQHHHLCPKHPDRDTESN